MNPSYRLDCTELDQLSTDYLENHLPHETKMRFTAHLATCESCVERLDQMRTTLSALGRLPKEPLSRAMRRRLLRAFTDWHRRRWSG